MTDAHREYVVAASNGADDMDEDDPKVTGGQDAAEFLATLETPRQLPAIPPTDSNA
jgi:hypothetical protein